MAKFNQLTHLPFKGLTLLVGCLAGQLACEISHFSNVGTVSHAYSEAAEFAQYVLWSDGINSTEHLNRALTVA